MIKLDYTIMLIALTWTICGIISYGFDFAYYQRNWPLLAEKDHRHDQILCLTSAMFGPIDLLYILIHKQYRHGLMFI